MLKALELSGFKSFADRTRFEFPRGVSVVVGPNGSGKSNLVDAVKWVLGSQSAKSLRGKEMTDVIFNGSASRGPMGTGEATLTLDNSDGALPIDSREVHVTRRVYRSGEGEYLINRQPCRLRDIRDLLAGTGITTEAYCIIEQGRVDALLQSSPRERRVIFEEAAGISQFKAKKGAAMRRVERVEQNLLRLSDIVDEVESRLRSVRMQAGKARRYRENAQRLQELRTHVGLVDWRKLSHQIDARDRQLAELGQRAGERAAALERIEAQESQLEKHLESIAARLREIEVAASTTREEIAARQSAIEHQRARRADLEQEVARFRRQLLAMTTQAEGATGEVRDAAALLESAERALEEVDGRRREHLSRLDAAQQRYSDAQNVLDQTRTRFVAATHASTTLRNQWNSLEAQLPQVQAARQQTIGELEALRTAAEARAAELALCERADAELAAEAASHQETLRVAEERLAHVRRELTRTDKHHRQLESQLARTRERITVLTELEQRLAGIDSGVREVLQSAAGDPQGPWRAVLGVVADLFHVDVDTAPLVEAALGDRAQYVVLSSAADLFEWLERESPNLGGRVGFLRLDLRAAETALDHVDLTSEAGVMGRADRYVDAPAEYAPLVRRLLGRTWFVDRLSTALRLAQRAGRGLEFVTSDGELLASDGTLVLGPRQAATGVLSRRSELRACQEQVAELEKQVAQHMAAYTRLDEDRSRQEQTTAASIAAYAELATRLAERRHQTATVRAQLEQLTRDEQILAEGVQRAEEQSAEIEQRLHATREAMAATEESVGQREREAAAAEVSWGEIRQSIAELQSAATELQIAAAKCEERVEMLRSQKQQAERDQQQRDRALQETRERLAGRESQLAALDQSMLEDRQRLAQLFVHKEQQGDELAQCAAESEARRRERSALQDQLRGERQQLAALQSQQHKVEVANSKLRHERQTLCERMQDDYGIDLAGQAASAEAGGDSGELGNRDAVEHEIAELRNQLNTIGAVNLDALEELDDLEARFGRLSQQYRDLVEAKSSLERVIQRINTDSRQIFLTTLEVVRGHFQELFRRLFGGGEADIIVDDAEDVLECGIEIVARPPGKESCSISLLSGGEKTLTCVALLLAVFRSKPSPFCVLDEVDAALDESNIGRFIGVLREFLSFTQFIVVSHSKRTMAGGDTLYGVTMEESGVSKRVSVRFEDVSEDGHIRPGVASAGLTPGDGPTAADEPAADDSFAEAEHEGGESASRQAA